MATISVTRRRSNSLTFVRLSAKSCSEDSTDNTCNRQHRLTRITVGVAHQLMTSPNDYDQDYDSYCPEQSPEHITQRLEHRYSPSPDSARPVSLLWHRSRNR